MAAGQNELGLFVLCQRECRRFVPLQIVAAITTVEIRSGGELSCMLVGVAVRTALELDLEQRIFPVGSVASRAEHCGMSALQGIAVAAWSFTVNVEGLNPSTVWQEAHSPPPARLANCPLCGSGW